MISMIVLAAVAMVQEVAPVPPRIIMTNHEPRQAGVTPVENRTLSQPHRNMDLRMFPDIAVKSLRIDGNTLYALVANEGRTAAKGPIKVMAIALNNGVKSQATPVRLARLNSHESQWVAITNFAALNGASSVSAEAMLPPPSAALDRSGRGCDPAMCLRELDVSNNGLRAAGPAIQRGKP